MGLFLHSVPGDNTDLSDTQHCTEWQSWQAKSKSFSLLNHSRFTYFFFPPFNTLDENENFAQEQGEKKTTQRAEGEAASLPKQALLRLQVLLAGATAFVPGRLQRLGENCGAWAIPLHVTP